MGRASFGGSSDYSALFASLYGAQDIAAKQAEYDAKQAAAEAKAKQAAQDQDMADQWANGVISNEAWLAYIATRVQQTAGDPTEHEKWVKYQRKYQEQIADSTAEFNFANGGSINDLIAYYQVKIAGKTPDSKDTQKDQLRLNELIDQRASETVAKGAQAIVDRINAGTGTYEELLKFEKSALADVRPGSALEQQLRDQIDKVTAQIAANKSDARLAKAEYDYNRGKLTGKAYAAILRTEAEQYKLTDPKRYYQFLGAAADYLKNPGLKGAGAAAAKAAAAAHDANQAARDIASYYVDAYNKGLRQIADFNDPNKVVALTPDFIHKQDLAVLASLDSDAGLAAARGDKSTAANYAKQKAEYINSTVVGHNTMAVADREAHIASARAKQLDFLQGEGFGKVPPSGAVDPASARETFSAWIEADRKALAAQTHVTSQQDIAISPRFGEGATATRTVVGAEKTGVRALDPAYVDVQTKTLEAYSILNTPGVTDAQVAQAWQLIGTAYGTDENGNPKAPPSVLRTASAILNNSRNLSGMTDGSRTLILNAAGKPQWVDMKPSVDTYGPDGKPIAKTVPDYAKAGWTGDNNTKIVDVVVDVNGVPRTMKAVATLAASDLLVWLTNKTITIGGTSKGGGGKKLPPGTVLTSEDIKALDALDPNWRNTKEFSKAPDPNIGYYYKVVINAATDGSGKPIGREMWTQDPETGQWVKGDRLDIRTIQRDPSGDGTVLVLPGADGKGVPQVTFGPDAGYVVPYVGRDPARAQEALNAGLTSGTVALPPLKGRGINGTLTPDPSRPPQVSLYNPYLPKTTNPANRDDWYNEDHAARLAEADKLRRTQLAALNTDRTELAAQRAGAAADVGRGVLDMAKGVIDFAKSLGVNFDVPGTKPQPAFKPSLRTGAVPDAGGGLASGPSIAPSIKLPVPSAVAANDARKSPTSTLPAITVKPGSFTPSSYMAGATKDDPFAQLPAPETKPPTPVTKTTRSVRAL